MKKIFKNIFIVVCLLLQKSNGSINYSLYSDFEKYHYSLIPKYAIKNNGTYKLLSFIEALYGYNPLLLDSLFNKEILLASDLFSLLFNNYIENINNDIFESHDFKRLLLIGIFYHKKNVKKIESIIHKRKVHRPDEANLDAAFESIIKNFVSLEDSILFLKQALEYRMNMSVNQLKNIFSVDLFTVNKDLHYVKNLLENLRIEIEKLKAFFPSENGLNDLMMYIKNNQKSLKDTYKMLLQKSNDFKNSFRKTQQNDTKKNINVCNIVIINIICCLIKLIEVIHSSEKFVDEQGSGLVPMQIILSKKFINYFDDLASEEEEDDVCCRERLITKYYNCINIIIENPFFINMLFGAAYFIDYFSAIHLMQTQPNNLVEFYNYATYNLLNNKYVVHYENFCHPSLLSSHARVLNTLLFPEDIKHLFIVGPSGSGKTLLIRSMQIIQELIKKYGISIGNVMQTKLYDVIIDYNNICSIIRSLDEQDALDNDIPLKNSDGRIQYTAMLIICDLIKINKDKNFLIIMNEPFVNVPLEQLSERNPHSLLFNLELLFRFPNATVLYDSHLGCLKYFSFIRAQSCKIALGYMPIEKDSVAIWSSYPTFKLTINLPENYSDNVISTTQILQKVEELPDESFMRYAMLASFGEAMRLKSRILEELGYQKGFLVL